MCIHAIFYGGCPKHLELCREVVGESLDDDSVTTKGEMGAVLLRRPDGNDEPRIALDVCAHRTRGQVLEQ